MQPTKAIVGEEGPEAVIPLTKPSKAKELLDGLYKKYYAGGKKNAS